MRRSTIVLLGAALATAAATSASSLASVAGARASHQPGRSHARAHHAHGTRVTVRVEGIHATLLAATDVDAVAKPIDPDGKPADTCEGDTVAVALQDATRGHWAAGKYYSGLGYTVEGILGESYAFSSPYYWALWLDGKPASAGICTATLHAGEQVLFFPQCSKESAAQCPQGLFDPPVLALRGPTHARAGKAVTFRVSSLANASGKPAPGAGAQVRAAGKAATANSAGVAKLTFARPGRYRVVASAAGAIRDELSVRVRR